MRPVWIGEGNAQRIAELPSCATVPEVFATAVSAMADGELFFPWGEALWNGEISSHGGKAQLLSVQGLIRRLCGETNGFGPSWEHLMMIFKQRYPLHKTLSLLTHAQAMEVLQIALRTPERQVDERVLRMKKKSIPPIW